MPKITSFWDSGYDCPKLVFWGAPGWSTPIEMVDLTASVFLTTERSFLPSFSLRNEVWGSLGVNVEGIDYQKKKSHNDTLLNHPIPYAKSIVIYGQSTLYFLTPATPKLNFWGWKLVEMIFPLSGTHWRLIQTFQLRLITSKYHFRATTSRISKRGDFWHFLGDISGTYQCRK